MARIFLLCVSILLLVFGSVSLSGADSGGADKRDAVVDNAIGGMREGSRIIAPDSYGKKTEIPKVPGAQLSPIADTGAIAGAAAGGAAAAGAAGAAGAGNFPGGASSGALSGANEGAAGAGGTTADSGGGSLIGIDANADLSSGSVDTGVSLDTNNTDQILDADLTAGAGGAGSVTGSSDITAGDLTADSGLPPETTESAISPETIVGTEVDTSGGTVGGEADVGVEADVVGGTESDAASDPADGLPAPGL